MYIKQMNVNIDERIKKNRRFFKIPYKVRVLWKRLKLAFSWGVFVFRQNPWQEYDTFLPIVRKRLLDMADEFESSHLTVSAPYDASRMRLAAKLIGLFLDEHYHNAYTDAHWLEDKEPEDNKWGEFFGKGGFDDSYSLKDAMEAGDKDKKALRIAMAIIAHNLPGWWQ